MDLKKTFKKIGAMLNLRDGRLNPINPVHIIRKRKMLRFYSEFIKEGDLCFDVGANVGNRTEVFLKLGASVVAVEPQKTCMDKLKKKYGKNKKIILINKALGEKEGQATMNVSNVHEISSLSERWLKKVKTTGRFLNWNKNDWSKKVKVPLTTLDILVKKYGIPAFCKIDVEGFELNVLKGLSKPIKAISIEFTPEDIEQSIMCIKYLSTLGKIKLNYSMEESMEWGLPKWVGPKEMSELLLKYLNPQHQATFGDIYIKFE